VEEVLAVCGGKSVLDMCTGSGCIIISIASLGKPVRAVGADISPDALKIADRNAAKNNASVEFVQSNLFEKVEGKFDIIVSNPPYIPTGEIEGLMPEVKDHEPLLALDGAADGLYFYEKITASLKDYLNRGGNVLYEIGCEQGEAVSQILKNAGFTDIAVKKDLSGLDRVVTASWP
jgi:release factor glutamine methyltransferase